VADVPLKQCAAVVTTRGWINVPVHDAKPFTPTVLGQSQASLVCPPTTSATVGSLATTGCGSLFSGTSTHALAANETIAKTHSESLRRTECLGTLEPFDQGRHFTRTGLNGTDTRGSPM
jgi:hypothetical protein